jgi:pimeloyl-ACP methyl ester carboxylesterase
LGIISFSLCAQQPVLKPNMNIWDFNTPGALMPLSSAQICSRMAITTPDIPGVDILDMSATQLRNYSEVTGEAWDTGPLTIAGLDVCSVTITYTHPGWDDTIHVETWLPLSGWNGRFQASSGGGWVTGFRQGLAIRAAQGYAVSVTDGGHAADSSGADEWALNEEDGLVNLHLLEDFASLALHELAVIGKSLTESFYGVPPAYSYWNGCSTGGRQGLMLAQRYPTDFDGIVAAAPAINWDVFVPATFWPQVVMNQMGVYPELCEFNALREAAIQACDALDGVRDRVLSAPGSCDFNPLSVVGQPYQCDGGSWRTITKEAAVLAQLIWKGPVEPKSQSRRWYGLNYDASFWLLPRVSCISNDTGGRNCRGHPFEISEEWLRLFVINDRDFDMSSLSFEEYDTLLEKSKAVYKEIIGTSQADLSTFREAGGKMITWHGLADEAIPANGTSDYYQQVLKQDPAAADFYRYFEAPGVAHCVQSISKAPYPQDVLASLIAWVEEGKAPETLKAEWRDPVTQATLMKRELCAWPLVARYHGGDITQASSYVCDGQF